ncbi:helix-turn-helix domain-containing protein [Mesomycoplasma ovipneumoniae]|uniref:helix-turn-helix domain-containing protein n=1 Tax=Mesomycoplasma ovipneumoniae TaxID=29562 RepID=UPI0018AF7423
MLFKLKNREKTGHFSKIISSNWETREYISLRNIERICEELNCKIEDVIIII